jgi:hypothetical protein
VFVLSSVFDQQSYNTLSFIDPNYGEGWIAHIIKCNHVYTGPDNFNAPHDVTRAQFGHVTGTSRDVG